MTDPNQPRKRFRFRLRRLTSFSLRTALIAITVLAVCLGLHMNSVRKQRASVEAVHRHGGRVFYDYEHQRIKHSIDPKDDSPVPVWLLNTFGRDHFHNVFRADTQAPNLRGQIDLGELSKTVDLLGKMDGFPKLEFLILDPSQANDRGLRYAGQHGNLRTLVIFGPVNFTEQGVAHLAHLQKLEGISIMSTQITGSFFQELSRLPNLEDVSIGQSEFVDDDVKYLQELTQIRSLYLGPNKESVTDRDLAHLKHLTQLEALVLNGSNVTDTSLRYVAGLKNLRYLSLNGPNITNNGLRHVAGLKNLRYLSLSGHSVTSSVTEDGLRHLSGLEKLEGLELRRTKVKDASWLQERLPKCRIRF